MVQEQDSDSSLKQPLESFLSDANEASGKASEISRNLGLGAIAIIWIFKNPENEKLLLPNVDLIKALLFAVFSLSLDLFQYVFRAVTLNTFYLVKEHRYDKAKVKLKKRIEDVHTPPFISHISWELFYAKIFSIIVAYYYISRFLIEKL